MKRHVEVVALHFDPERFWKTMNAVLTQEERDKVNALLDEGDLANLQVRLDSATNEITFLVSKALSRRNRD